PLHVVALRQISHHFEMIRARNMLRAGSGPISRVRPEGPQRLDARATPMLLRQWPSALLPARVGALRHDAEAQVAAALGREAGPQSQVGQLERTDAVAAVVGAEQREHGGVARDLDR